MAGPVDLVLLRRLLPDVPLRPGATVTGRVLDARTLVLEGVRLAAELPDDVETGQILRLRVQGASGDRLQLRIVERPAPGPQAQQVPQAAYALALPGGSEARVFVDEREPGGRGRAGEARSVVLRYDSPALGRMDVRLTAHPPAAAIHVAAGEPAEAVREAATVLAQALERAAGRPAQVTVHPRGETFSASA